MREKRFTSEVRNVNNAHLRARSPGLYSKPLFTAAVRAVLSREVVAPGCLPDSRRHRDLASSVILTCISSLTYLFYPCVSASRFRGRRFYLNRSILTTSVRVRSSDSRKKSILHSISYLYSKIRRQIKNIDEN